MEKHTTRSHIAQRRGFEQPAELRLSRLVCTQRATQAHIEIAGRGIGQNLRIARYQHRIGPHKYF
jgi:hypothetical protein